MEMNVSRDKKHALIETGLSVLVWLSMFLPGIKIVGKSIVGETATTSYSFWAYLKLSNHEIAFWVLTAVCIANIAVQNMRKCTWLSYYVSLIPLYFAGKVLAESGEPINMIYIYGTLSAGIGVYLALICGLVMLIRSIIEMGMNAREHKVFWRVYWIILGASFIWSMTLAQIKPWPLLVLPGVVWILQLPMLLGALLSLIMHFRKKGNGEGQQQPQPQPARPTSSKASSGTNRKPLLIAGAALVVVVGIVLLVFCRGGEKDGPFRGQWEEAELLMELDLYEPTVHFRNTDCYGFYYVSGCDEYVYCISEVKEVKGNTAKVVFYDFFNPTDKAEITITYHKEDGSLSFEGKEEGFFPHLPLSKRETPIDTSSF